MSYKKSEKIINCSQRGYILFLSKTKIYVYNGNVVYSSLKEDIEYTYNIPYLNTQFILLGYGTSISQEAANILSSNNIIILFVSNKFNLISTLTPENSILTNKYALKLTESLFVRNNKILLAKNLFITRHSFNKSFLSKKINLDISSDLQINNLLVSLDNLDISSTKIETILGLEGNYVKFLNQKIKEHLSFDNSIEYKERLYIINNLCYSLSSIVLTTLNIPFYLNIYHGRTNKGSLKYDIADLIKGISMPLVLLSLDKKQDFFASDNEEFKKKSIDFILKNKLLENLFKLTIDGLMLGKNNV